MDAERQNNANVENKRQWREDEKRENLAPLGIEPKAFEPVARRYTK
jgi:hypothetical protein